MIHIIRLKNKSTFLFKLILTLVLATFITSLVLPPYAQAQGALGVGISTAQTLNLPVPGAQINPTSSFNPPIIKGLKLYPDNPLRFDFMMDTGDDHLEGPALKEESNKLIKYFLAALTVPEDEMWVNLSPYEKDRIIPAGFGRTEMGRDLLAQDYLLKQLTASLMYPEEELGKEFWKRVYAKAQAKYGTTEIPVNTFNKVWIVPEKAVVYTHEQNAFVIESHLKVMLEEDYKSAQMSAVSDQENKPLTTEHLPLTAKIMKEIIIPEIEREVNEGKTFANLRQIYYAVILATWYKQNLKESLLGHLYVNQNKTSGVDTGDPEVNQKIYQQYLEAFKKGVVDLIKEDYDPDTQQVIQRKYFSGGAVLGRTERILEQITDSNKAMIATGIGPQIMSQMDRGFVVRTYFRGTQSGEFDPLAALVAQNNGERKPLEVSPVAGEVENQEAALKKISERDRAIIKKFNDLQGVTKVVDMGSGSGTFSAEYRVRFPNDAIIGYEINEVMIKADDWQVLGDAGRTGLLNESVDKVTINMPDPKDVGTVIPHLVKEARRILKPGGEIYIVFESPNNTKPVLVTLVKNGEKIILRTLKEFGFMVEHAGEPLDPDYPRTAMMERYETRYAGINLFKAKRLPSLESTTDQASLATAAEEQRKKDHQAFLKWARNKVYNRLKKYFERDNMNLRYESSDSGYEVVKEALAVDPQNGKLYVHFHGGYISSFEFGVSALPTLSEAEGLSVQEVASMIIIDDRDVFVSTYNTTKHILMLRLTDIQQGDQQLRQDTLRIIDKAKLKIAQNLETYWQVLREPPSNIFQENEGVFKLRLAIDASKSSVSTRNMEGRKLTIVFPGVKKVPDFALAENADRAQSATALENDIDVGGIDLNPAILNLKTEGEAIEFAPNFDPQQLQDIHINGLFPVIMNISPITNLPQLFGVGESPSGPDNYAKTEGTI